MKKKIVSFLTFFFGTLIGINIAVRIGLTENAPLSFPGTICISLIAAFICTLFIKD